MKKINLFKLTMAVVCCAFTLAMTSCSDDDNPSLSFTSSVLEINVDDTEIIKVAGGTQPYTVTSNNPEVATASVDEDNISITGVKDGTAIITVTDDAKITGTIAVTVKAANQLPVDKESVEIAVDGEEVITIAEGTAPYTAEVEDQTIASTTIDGDKVTVKGLKAGTTKVVITDDDQNTATINVTVK